ncbi:hypothetical protein CYMTET_42506 [Cymbomonas tetramitiformis]|uniref:RNA polymerase sigma-70 domain-containing protein n=1 Tax=Cymbomonas tetramitiformis TaxID=36881 RepID=A0AAE0C5Q4_9CHLO|nr:hypothetical protein CYMTET_42506 [Cymbomonas tetramitiformis]
MACHGATFATFATAQDFTVISRLADKQSSKGKRAVQKSLSRQNDLNTRKGELPYTTDRSLPYSSALTESLTAEEVLCSNVSPGSPGFPGGHLGVERFTEYEVADDEDVTDPLFRLLDEENQGMESPTSAHREFLERNWGGENTLGECESVEAETTEIRRQDLTRSDSTSSSQLRRTVSSRSSASDSTTASCKLRPKQLSHSKRAAVKRASSVRRSRRKARVDKGKWKAKESNRTSEKEFQLGLGNELTAQARAVKQRNISEHGSSGDDHVSHFLQEIGHTSVLTQELETTLSLRAQDCLKLEQAQVELVVTLGRLPSIEEWGAAAKVAPGELHKRLQLGREAKQLMVEHNLRLVVHIAKRYGGRGVPLGDLIQEGTVGLIKGVEKFDQSKGFKFSTYAHWWIRQAVTRALSDQSRTIRLPVHVYDTLSRIRKAQRALTSDDLPSGHAPSEAAIARYVGLPVLKVRLLLESSQQLIELDGAEYSTQDKGERETSLIDAVQAEHGLKDAPESECEMRFLREDLDMALATLHPRERNILCMRYGLASADGRTMTLKDIGRAYGVTRERIRQIEDKALRKLRHPCRSVSLVDYLPVLTS